MYAQAIADQALGRGISVEVLDAGIGELALSCDGRRVTTIQSLSELTSAVAYRRCGDKLHSRRVLERAGLRVPAGRVASFDDEDEAFLDDWKEIVVKPARGERGDGVTPGVVDRDGLARALKTARAVFPAVLLEQRCDGEDLRVVVIDGQVEGASVRRPPTVTGDGERTLRQLIEHLSRERADASEGVAGIPLDDVTLQVVQDAGYDFDGVLSDGTELTVRDTANVHTGGTADDVTDDLHHDLVEVAVAAAGVMGCPVAGVDLMVPAVDGPDYVVIEVNEQPGLASYGSQHTVERFVDPLFPDSSR
jgi:GNAT-family acetyltransferase (TIGR03103 family)